ncbi:hypothetical protein WS71_16555 [Burkholderia mayonis]|uniref:Uncharacterized protein n=1 Tax=Burkholderia mayonis TaxID=1385591 RepID=A0A1B4FZ95_9BURK|nr:hypothetical protein WS71_16555 [Burkholderia mayonis]KVE55918.1 hypothetical protein WS71_29945 [Burkholderia mayonis]
MMNAHDAANVRANAMVYPMHVRKRRLTHADRGHPTKYRRVPPNDEPQAHARNASETPRRRMGRPKTVSIRCAPRIGMPPATDLQ